jgi:hypothetical protein
MVLRHSWPLATFQKPDMPRVAWAFRAKSCSPTGSAATRHERIGAHTRIDCSNNRVDSVRGYAEIQHSLERWSVGHSAELGAARISTADRRAAAATRTDRLRRQARWIFAEWVRQILQFEDRAAATRTGSAR